MKRHWKRLGGEVVYDAGIFRVRSDRYEFRGQPAGHPFHIIESRDWVNVVALTDALEVVLVRQFRHGTQDDSLEVPGGQVDQADPGPADGAARELREETGYGGSPVQLLGSVTSNPAILTNRTYTYLTTGAVRVADPTPDEHEALEVELHARASIRDLIQSGEIHHSLSVVALTLFLLRADRGDT